MRKAHYAKPNPILKRHVTSKILNVALWMSIKYIESVEYSHCTIFKNRSILSDSNEKRPAAAKPIAAVDRIEKAMNVRAAMDHPKAR